jgi:hypothetical protein
VPRIKYLKRLLAIWIAADDLLARLAGIGAAEPDERCANRT